MARDGFLLPFLSSFSFSFPLIRLHRKSELPFVCNGESRKGEGARSTAREGETKEREEEEEEEREDEKGPESGVGTKEGDDEEDAERRRIQLSFPSTAVSLSFYSTLFSRSLSLSRHRCLFLTLDLFRTSTIYLRASNKKK